MSKENMNQQKVIIHRYSEKILGIIVRETATQYIVKYDSSHKTNILQSHEMKFRKSDLFEIGAMASQFIRIPNEEELKAFELEYEKRILSNKFKEFNFSKLSNETLRKIDELIKEAKEE